MIIKCATRATRPVINAAQVRRNKWLAMEALTCFCTMLDVVEEAIQAAKRWGARAD